MTPSGLAPAAAEPSTPLSRRTARALLWIEKYPLPLVYVWFAWGRWETLRAVWREYHLALSMSVKLAPGWQNLYYASLGRNALLFALMVFSGVTLLLNRAPSVAPDKFKHVVVPLAGSYYFVFYGPRTGCRRRGRRTSGRTRGGPG